jgi:hypothetical protein
MELGSSLEPIAPFRDKINVINGLFNREGDGGHARCTGNILSGASLRRGRLIQGECQHGSNAGEILRGTDRPAQFGPGMRATRQWFPRKPILDGSDASHISWRSPDSPIPIELYPSLAFDSLFGSKAGKLQGSILDDVLQQANDLRGKVSGSDRLKLEEYFSSVRETEQRVQRLNRMAKEDTPAVPLSQRPATGRTERLPNRMRG